MSTDLSALPTVGYYCDHSDEPLDARTHHDWEWVEGEGFVFQHQPDTISAQLGAQDYLSPEKRGRRCPRAKAVYSVDTVESLLAEIAKLQAKLDVRERQLDDFDMGVVA
ncbi:hypothetical protein ACGF5F_32425 [Streptomyces sp. NPDC047821]|uniref:hypothetical protein n=1 Tax=Streptomyces sp. NPDC047821 TaxID=3365488 RepID=UPI00371F7EFB